MLSTSKCILRNRKFLESITCKVNNGAFLHVCCNNTSVKQPKNEKRFLHVQLDKRNHLNAFLVTTIPGVRLISTSINEATIATNVSVKSSIDTINESKQLGVETSPTLATDAVAAENSSHMEEVTSAQISQSDVQLHSFTTVDSETSPVSEFPIPDPPSPPTPVVAGEETTSLLVDPPFEHLGLTGWSPVGLIEQGFEFLHVNLGCPWWQCILIGTIIVRVTLFPIVVISQRNSARLSNNLPEFQEIQRKINEAKQRGENIEAARYTQDLMLFMKEKQINPIKNALIPLVQAPIFISFFMSLREMANIPVRSMREGGLFWFTDLTVPDQMYILPIITSLTMLATIEVGADTGKMASSNSYLVKTILRCLPIVIFPFTINFPGAILMYWVSSNTISLTQVALFQSPRVRDFLKIEQKIVHDVSKLPAKPKSFIKGVKTWWKETRTQGEHLDRPRKNQLSFVTAGRGAVPKTYKYDPTISRTAQSSTSASVQSKK